MIGVIVRRSVQASLVAGTLTALTAGPAMSDTQTPYAGQQARTIAALSEADIAALEAGQGWGFALAAELNGYPGPAHVLELAEQLELSDEQSAIIASIFERMQDAAQALGARFILAEAELDAAFEHGTMTPTQLTEMTASSAALRAELRAVHLAAHLETKPLLNRHQIMIYDQLRGYSGADLSGHGSHGGH